MSTLQNLKATKLELLKFNSIPIRTFWITSIAFFMCFFAWFGIVPFMPDVVRELGLTPDQKWNSIILAVTGTVFARLLIGKLCDKYGPRLCYTWLLILGAIPVILIGFVQTPLQFLICRLFIGFIGASFVITQVHTSIMFAPNVVGTANATSAGWGNLGGGRKLYVLPTDHFITDTDTDCRKEITGRPEVCVMVCTETTSIWSGEKLLDEQTKTTQQRCEAGWEIDGYEEREAGWADVGLKSPSSEDDAWGPSSICTDKSAKVSTCVHIISCL